MRLFVAEAVCYTVLAVLVAASWRWPAVGALGILISVIWLAGLLGYWRFVGNPRGRYVVFASLLLAGSLPPLALSLAQGPTVSAVLATAGLVLTLMYFGSSLVSASRVFDRVPDDEDDLGSSRFSGNLPYFSVVKILSGGGESSGFHVRPDGYVVTNAHCVQGAPQVRIVLANMETFDAEVVAIRPEWDLALLRFDAPFSMPSVRLESSDTVVAGDALATVGMEPWTTRIHATVFLPEPHGRMSGYLNEPIVVPGVASGFTSPQEEGEFSLLCVASNDVLRPGYSGSPVAAYGSGRVVAVHCGGYGGLEMGYAIPTELVKRMMSDAGVKPKSRSLFWRMRRNGDSGRQALGFGYRWAVVFFSSYESPRDLEGEATLKHNRDSVDWFLERQPNQPVMLSCDAMVRVAEGDWEGARRQAARALEGGVANSSCQLLANTAKSPADYEENLRLAETALDLRRALTGYLAPRARVYIHRLRYEALWELGRFEECLLACEDALPDARAIGDCFPPLMLSGRCLLHLGEPGAAVARLNEALDVAQSEGCSPADWTQLIEALLAEGSRANLQRALSLALWHVHADRNGHLALPLGAEAATRLGADATAVWMRDLAKALSPDTDPGDSVEPLATALSE
jgi:hypothetical protein